jgi:O-antigen/teichoic acid export membrane protein
MLQKIKQLFSDSAAFAIAMMGNKLVALFLFPIYTRSLEPSQFGDWDMTNTIAMVVTYLCILGTDTALAFYFFDAKDETERRAYFTSSVLFPTAISLIFLLLALLAGAPLANVLYENPTGYEALIFYAMLTIVANVIIQQVLAYARFSRRVWTFNIGSMGYVIGSSVLSIYFVVYEGAGVVGIFVGQVIGQWIVALILMWMFRKEFTRHFTRKHIMDLLHYGAPLLPTLLAFWVMNALSRPMIYHMISPEQAGIFGAAVRLASMIALLTAAFQLAWRPFSMSIKEREDAPRIYSLLGRAFLVIGTFFIMGLTFIIEPLVRLITGSPEYFAAYPYVWMLSLGTVLNTMHLIVGVGLLIHKQTKTISKTFMVASVLYFIGNFILIPVVGVWGTAAMSVITYLFVFLSIYRKAQTVYTVDFRMRSMLSYFALYLGLMVGITWLQVNDWQGLWFYYVIAVIVLVAAVFVTGLFDFRSLAVLRQRLLKPARKR